MKRISFLLFFLHIISGFAQTPFIDVFLNDRRIDCTKTINDTCLYYVRICVQYDSIQLSATFPKMYLQSTDSIRIKIDDSIGENKYSTTYWRKTNRFTMSKYTPGVYINCPAAQYDISMIFIGDMELFEDSVKITCWNDNYAYTGGFWERCGLPTNIFNPYRISQPNSQIVYSIYDATGGCNIIPEHSIRRGQIRQLFDSRGRCVKEMMGDISVVYKYSVWGKLKKELWYKCDSLLYASAKYVHYGNNTKATYRMVSSGEKFYVNTHEKNQIIEERCYNEIGAMWWDRITHKSPSKLESVIEINNNDSLRYKKKYDFHGNILTEGFIGNNHYISYDYTMFDSLGDWTQIIQYEIYNGVKIPIRIIEKEVIIE